MERCIPRNEIFRFNVRYKNEEFHLQLPQHNTVYDLKLALFDKLNLVPSKQLINCWSRDPEDDNDILGKCCDTNSSYLSLYNADDLMKEFEAERRKEEEILAATEFIEYFSDHYYYPGWAFHVCRLEDAISNICFTDVEKRKILLLYFHNKTDQFARNFAENITQTNLKETINSKYFLLGWNVENETYHPALKEALNGRAELSTLVHFIDVKKCAALLIVPIKSSFIIFSCLKDKVSKKNFCETLKKAEEFLKTENQTEKDLQQIQQSENDITATAFQQIMLDLLGDRDYDNFDKSEHEYLKKKIAHGLFGQPQSEDGYEAKQLKMIERLYKKITEQNNVICKWKDCVRISFIYICTEPLPKDKQRRAKKSKDYNPHTDFQTIPLFVLRKCKNSDNPCRIFIDDTGRVYESWQEYLIHNKLPQCEITLPLNGRYQADENGKVKLEKHLSPACGIDHKILQVTDIASTAGSLVSGGVFIAAAIPAVTVAPVALVAAGVTGVVLGLYTIGRSAFSLYDRGKHDETLSFLNSEARGAYFNILAGSLGFVGAGANFAVSKLVAQGFNISKGATITVDVINVVNIGTSGASVVNSGYAVVHDWITNNQKPSLLTIIQLSSSVLFFGHAVYNFKTTGAIIEESQIRTLKEYQDSLRSNRHRKTFNKMVKETIRQNKGDIVKGKQEVIKTITKIQNKDEVFATLTRLNKKMNSNDIKFSAENGEIKLNGIKVDLNKVSTMDAHEVTTFFQTLPSKPEPTQSEIRSVTNQVENGLAGVIPVKEIAFLGFDLAKIFANTDLSMKDKIIKSILVLIRYIFREQFGWMKQLDELFPGVTKFLRIANFVCGHFKQLIGVLEEKYQKWLASKNPEFEEPIFIKCSLEYSKRLVEFFHYASRIYFVGNTVSEAGLKAILKDFVPWLLNKYAEHEETVKRKNERVKSGSPKLQAKCSVCGGDYYTSKVHIKEKSSK